MPYFKQEPSRLSGLIIALFLCVSGCGTKSNEPAATGKGTVSINGIDFELPWQVEAVEAIKAGQLDAAHKGITLANDRYKLEVVEGKVKLNGKDYGPVNRGEHVRLTEGGVLSVNGVERKPQEAKP
jgi:hypothetical protein